MVSGNINLINDVMKALNRSGWRISQVMILYLQSPLVLAWNLIQIQNGLLY
jgi:hypothetical protein